MIKGSLLLSAPIVKHFIFIWTNKDDDDDDFQAKKLSPVLGQNLTVLGDK